MCSATVAGAQAEQGDVVVSVVDAKDLGPLADSRVLLFGQFSATALTGHDGRVQLSDVPAGLYRVQIKRAGYVVGVSEEFAVSSGRLVRINISLVPRSLPTIGAIKIRQSITISSSDVSTESPVRKVSESLPDALDKIAGVGINKRSNDSGAAQTISLRNHDETQTRVTVDGVPLGPPGLATNLSTVSTDLFTGAGVDFRPSAAALGGTVNFRTLQPTQTWQEHAGLSYGNYNHSTYDVGLTGSIGRLGVAVQHTWRGAATPATGSVFVDQSGLNYAHGGETVQTGDMLKARYRLGERTSISASTLISNRSISPLCTADVTNVPCGIGPGNAQSGRNAFGYLSVLSLIGDASVQATAFSSLSTFDTNEDPRLFNSYPVPLVSLNQTISHGIALAATMGYRKHSFSLNASASNDSSRFNVFDASPFVTPSRYDERAATYELSDSFKVNDRLALSAQFSRSSATGSGASSLGGFGAAWHPSGNDTLTTNVAFGSAQAAQTTVRTFTDPVSARYDCQAGTVFVDGPGDDPAKQSSASYDLGWTHRFRHGQLDLDVYQQHQLGQSIGIAVPAALEPAGYLPSGYIDSLTGVWSFPVICGSSPFAPGGVYVNHLVSGTGRLYRGYDLSARFSLGPYVTVAPRYSTAVAIFQSGDSRLTGTSSTTVAGSQLPERPLHRAGVTVDGVIPKTGTQVILNAEWTGDNNVRHLGPYTIVNAGVSHNLGHGHVQFFVNNLFNSVAGVFSTLHAQPIGTVAGPPLSIAAIPVPPRQWVLSYAVLAGNTQAKSRRVQDPRQQSYTFGPPPQNSDPLVLAMDRPACDAQARPVAQDFVSALRTYVRDYNAGNSPAQIPGVDISLHETPSLAAPWWLELNFKDEQRYERSTDCTYVALYTQQEAQAAKLGFTVKARPPLSFAPGIGFYVVGPNEPPTVPASALSSNSRR